MIENSGQASVFELSNSSMRAKKLQLKRKYSVCLITIKWRAFLISILLVQTLLVSCTDQVSLKVRKIFLR
jgi:hypothetical protein